MSDLADSKSLGTVEAEDAEKPRGRKRAIGVEVVEKEHRLVNHWGKLA